VREGKKEKETNAKNKEREEKGDTPRIFSWEGCRSILSPGDDARKKNTRANQKKKKKETASVACTRPAEGGEGFFPLGKREKEIRNASEAKKSGKRAS